MDVNSKSKIGLVFSGGGIKAAAFHIGVCLALREKGFRFAGGNKDSVQQLADLDPSKLIRLYVGSSAGSVIATILACGYTVEDLMEAFERGASKDLKPFSRASRNIFSTTVPLTPISYRDIFAINGSNMLKFVPNFFRRRSLVSGGLEALIKNGFKINGIFTTQGLERYMRDEVVRSHTFQSLGVELFIVATQLNHSRKVIFGNFPETRKVKTVKHAGFASISQAIAASAALPPVFAPYKIPNQKGKDIYFFDGEIRDTLSSHVAEDQGADLVIASYSVQPYHYSRTLGSLHRYGIPMIVNQALYQVIEQKVQNYQGRLKQLAAIYDTLERYCKEQNFSQEQREHILGVIEEKANYHRDVDHIFIHPSPNDHEMFFVDHFSLNPEVLSRIVHIGFKSATYHLRKHGI